MRTPRIAQASLWTTIVLSAVAGGGAHPSVILVLAGLVAVVLVATILSSRTHIQLTRLPLLLGGLALFTVLQAVPLPAFITDLLSPRSVELRNFVGASAAWMPLSYEPSSTFGEAGKLWTYFIVALGAQELTRNRKNRRFSRVALAVVIAGVSSAFVALLQRLVGADRMLGILPSSGAVAELTTTFANPDHGAGFMVLSSMTALGLAAAEEGTRRRAILFGAASVLSIVCILTSSKMGIFAFGAALISFVLLAMRFKSSGGASTKQNVLAWGVLTVVLLGTSIFVLHQTDLGTPNGPSILSRKVAAMQDAGPLVLDHPLTGIGRGSYGSVYPAYKTSSAQLTFTNPENILVQLAADWGLIVGAIALLGLFGCVVLRVVRHSSQLSIVGAMVGVSAVLLLNLVDFSLELLGMAVSVIALLGATSRKKQWAIKVPMRSTLARVLTIVIVLLPLFVVVALSQRDDLEQALREPALDQSRMKEIAAAHPANAVFTARLAHLAEVADPPDYRSAIRWANRTLYLAPTYADGYLLAGRMLIRAGHRQQGFGEMRRAWSLSDDVTTTLDQIIDLARNPQEILRAVPIRDTERNIADVGELARAVLRLLERGRTEWGCVLVSQVTRTAEIDSDDLLRVGKAAYQTGDFDLAELVLSNRLEHAPNDSTAAEMLINVWLKRGKHVEIQQLVAKMVVRSDVNPAPLLFVQLESAIAVDDRDLARQTIETLRRKTSSRDDGARLARLEAEIYVREGNVKRAIETLELAVRLDPADELARMIRAQLLLERGRNVEARLELRAVLRSNPGHQAASDLLREVSGPKEDKSQ